jgi:hypothetical protein
LRRAYATGRINQIVDRNGSPEDPERTCFGRLSPSYAPVATARVTLPTTTEELSPANGSLIGLSVNSRVNSEGINSDQAGP